MEIVDNREEIRKSLIARFKSWISFVRAHSTSQSTSNIIKPQEQIEKEIRETVQKMIGPIAKPDQIQIVHSLPKTRSGKIMRRILRKIAEGDFSNFGDTTTLLNPEIVDEIKNERIFKTTTND